jgi:hypothetical protein
MKGSMEFHFSAAIRMENMLEIFISGINKKAGPEMTLLVFLCYVNNL